MSALKPVSFRKGRERAPRLSQPYVPGKHHERFWTEAEDAVIRRHYPTGGAAACLPHLPEHRTPGSVQNRAGKLQVACQLPGGGPKRKLDIPDDIDERIRDGWPELKGRGAVAAFADRLNVPRWWLTKRATKLGLTQPHRKEPPWTAAEEVLMRKVPLHDPAKAARIFREHGFKRSPTAIIIRAKRLDLSRRATRETLSATAAARILGVDNKTLSCWCIAGDIKAERRGTNRLPQQGGDSWDIRPEDLRRFVLDKLERIDIRKVDKFAFVALLVGDEVAPAECEAAATASSPAPRPATNASRLSNRGLNAGAEPFLTAGSAGQAVQGSPNGRPAGREGHSPEGTAADERRPGAPGNAVPTSSSPAQQQKRRRRIADEPRQYRPQLRHERKEAAPPARRTQRWARRKG
ncbi:MAG TPA: hypothetical protein VHG92_02840 [Afifellaceae bacterium]|nr:hypothetical protein [Afifellaceae bacterium]